MGYLQSTKSLLRRTILIGWAVAVVWIYLGNLVNFHQHHIWGKQLIPIACSSTRSKEKDAAAFVKNDRDSKSYYSGHHFNFATPDQLVLDIPYYEIVSSRLNSFDTPVLHLEIQTFSLRGPPTA